MTRRLLQFLVLWSCVLAFALVRGEPLKSQTAPTGDEIPSAWLVSTSVLEFPAQADSNSPAFWDVVDGTTMLRVVNSAGHPSLSEGTSLRRLGQPRPVTFSNEINGARWMEAVVPDVDGTLYGYYHNEPNMVCGPLQKTAPRIGAAKSSDGGQTWEDLGIILEAPQGSELCGTPNRYFVGGVGDFSVALDDRHIDLYIFFSTYGGPREQQGVAVARMLWADRDEPVGRVAVFVDGVWLDPVADEEGTHHIPPPTPIYPAATSWHDRSGRVDAFWGPSVHWNTHLNEYVMLLNRARSATWTQEGIYVAFSPVLDDPSRWTEPRKLLNVGAWYPQVMGLERGSGTDKQAGQLARFFLEGRSEHLIVFGRRESN